MIPGFYDSRSEWRERKEAKALSTLSCENSRSKIPCGRITSILASQPVKGQRYRVMALYWQLVS